MILYIFIIAISSGIIDKSQVLVSDVSDLSLQKISNLGIETTKNNSDIASNCEFILFAVKSLSIGYRITIELGSKKLIDLI